MKKLLALFTLTALLAGCGGGGSTPAPVSEPNTISGAAFKGLIDGGIVNVYQMTSNNTNGTLVGSAITNSNGEYTITLSDTYDSTKNVIIELTTGDTTSITCDARNGCGPDVARGESYAPTSDFKLSSISTPISGDNTASITPYTDMAKAYFDANPTAGVGAAISRVNQIAGVNILEVKPIDITGSTISSTASKEQQQYALMLGAYASTIFGDGTVSIVDSEAKIKSTSEGFSDGIFGNGGANDISATDLMTAVKAEVGNAGGTLNADMLSSVNAFVSVKEMVIVDGVLATETPVNTDLDTVSKAKVFITDTRTWVDSFDTLETPANAFSDEADSIRSILNAKTDVVFDNLIWVGEAVGEKLKYARDNVNATVPDSVVVTDGSGNVIGTATLTGSSDDINGATYTAEVITANGVEVSITASLNRDYINDSSIDGGTIVLDWSASAKKDDYAEVTFENSKFTLVTDVAIVEGADAELESASIEGGVFRAEILDVSGKRTGEMMEGNINLEFVKADDGDNATISEDGLNFKKFELTKLKITDENGSYANLTFRFNLDNAAAFNVDNSNTESSFMKGDFNITGELDLATKPKALVSLTASSSVYKRGTITLLVSYDSKSLEFTASNVGEDEKDRKLEVSNQDGYKFVFEWTELDVDSMEGIQNDGDVLKQNTGSGKLYAPGNVEVGKIDKTTNNITIIRYNDGTIESF